MSSLITKEGLVRISKNPRDEGQESPLEKAKTTRKNYRCSEGKEGSSREEASTTEEE